MVFSVPGISVTLMHTLQPPGCRGSYSKVGLHAMKMMLMMHRVTRQHYLVGYFYIF